MGRNQADHAMKHTSLGIIRFAKIYVKFGMEDTGHIFSATVMEKLGEETGINKRETDQVM